MDPYLSHTLRKLFSPLTDTLRVSSSLEQCALGNSCDGPLALAIRAPYLTEGVPDQRSFRPPRFLARPTVPTALTISKMRLRTLASQIL